MLLLKDIVKKYNSDLILDIPQMELDPGVFWIKGANGSGKSTLMKIIAGMIPFEGELQLFNVSLKANPVRYRKMISYAEAEPLYPPFLTGNDLISFYRKTRKASEDDVRKLQALFGVEAFAKNSVSTYSSGMVKKLSLVLAFIGEPKLILLDEPLVTIDKDSIPILNNLIAQRYQQDTHFIISSHQALEHDLLPVFSELIVEDHQLRFL